MVSNTVDASKFKGAGMDRTLCVVTSPETSKNDNRITRYAGAFKMDVIGNFGKGLHECVLCKYENNTFRDVAKRNARTRNSGEELSQ